MPFLGIYRRVDITIEEPRRNINELPLPPPPSSDGCSVPLVRPRCQCHRNNSTALELMSNSFTLLTPWRIFNPILHATAFVVGGYSAHSPMRWGTGTDAAETLFFTITSTYADADDTRPVPSLHPIRSS